MIADGYAPGPGRAQGRGTCVNPKTKADRQIPARRGTFLTCIGAAAPSEEKGEPPFGPMP